MSRIVATHPPSTGAQARYRADGTWGNGVDLVSQAARHAPTGLALVDRHERLSYAELDAAVESLALTWAAQGVSDESTIIVISENSCRAAVAVHALRRLGARCVMLSDHSGDAELVAAAQRTSPSGAVALGGRAEGLASRHPELGWLTVVPEVVAATEATFPASNGECPNLVLFTSGSTARPKGVVHSTSTIRQAATNYVEALELTHEDRLFVVSPLSSVTGVLQILEIAPLIHGCAVLVSDWDDEVTFDLLLDACATFYGGPDVILRRLFGEAARRAVSELPLRRVSLGGTMLDDELLEMVEHRFAITVTRAYGSSEAPMSTTTPLDAPAEVRFHRDGTPNRGVEVRLGSPRDPAECAISGPHLFLGYLDEEDNEGSFDGDWFLTGDAGTFEDGELKITGRLKEIVIRNGLKISMVEVEQLAASLAGVLDAACFVQPDPATGERLALALHVSPEARLSFEGVVDDLLARGLSRRSLPEEIVVWDEPFPLTTTQKLSRTALGAGSDGRVRYVAPRLRSGASEG